MPQLIYDIKFKIDQVGSIPNAAKLDKEVKELMGSIDEADQNVKGLNKSLAISNQALFSFSDLVQDSAQFSQGFAQGMRAIGNNIGFTAELIGNLNTKVDAHNDALSDAQKAQGQSTSVIKELGRSLKGVGGVILGINAVVLVSQFAFKKLDEELKKVTDSAKAQAEAISEVAKSFSELDTGADDPFGIRARSIEIDVLSKSVDGFNERESIGAFFEDSIASKAPLFLQRFAVKLSSIGSEQNRLAYEQIARNVEIQESIRTLNLTQDAYTKTVSESGSTLQNYVSLTGDFEKVLLENSTGIELTDESLKSLSVSTQAQIDLLVRKGVESQAEISTLQRLIKLQEDITLAIDKTNESRKKQLDSLFKAFQFTAKERLSSEERIKILQHELKVAESTTEGKRLLANFELKQAQINLDAESRIQDVKQKFIDEGYTKEQASQKAQSAITAINNERDLQLRIAEYEKDLEAQELYNDNSTRLEKERLDDLRVIREDANAEFKAQQAAIDLALLTQRGSANQLQIQNEYAMLEFQNKIRQINADNTLTDTQREAEIRIAAAELNKELITNEQNAVVESERAKQEARSMGIQGVRAASSLIQGIFGKSKEIAIAEAIISTYLSAQKAYASQFLPIPTPDSPARGAAAAAIAVAQGLARVAAIKNADTGGGGGGGSRSTGGGGGIGSRPRASGLFGTTDTASGSALNNQPLFTPNASEKDRGITVMVNNTFDDRTVASVASNGNDQRREGAVSGLG